MAIILVPLSNWGMLTTALIEYTPEFRFTLLLPMPAWYIRADGGASNAVWLTSR
jgi:hypothetical protein